MYEIQRQIQSATKNESSCKTTVRIKAEDGKIEEIVSTPGHKYYIPNNKINRNANETPEHASYEGLGDKWVSAKYLKVGERVLLSDGKYSIVVSVKTENCSPYTTYNLEVADFHTYYVGENGTLVHNACGFDKLYDDPGSLVGKSADDIGQALGDGFTRTSYGSRGDGFRFMDKYGNYIAYNTSGGRHSTAYYIIKQTNVAGRLKVVGLGYNPLNEARTTYFFFYGLIP